MMARVKIEEIIDHLDREIMKSLEATCKKHFPNQEFNSRDLFRTFKKEVYRKCSTWERVPDRYVEND